MEYIISYSKIKHGYVRLGHDGVLKLSIPIRLKGNSEFEKLLLEKGKNLLNRVEKRNPEKIDGIGEDYILVFGEKVNYSEFVILLKTGICSIEEQLKISKDTKYLKLNNSKDISRSLREIIDSGSSLEKQKFQKFLKTLLFNETIKFLDKYSNLLGIPYNKITIKSLKTKWGSCSSTQDIVINLKLLHLPKIYLEYVCIHEICHLKVKNHSSKFWNLVAGFCPEFKEKRKSLKNFIV